MLMTFENREVEVFEWNGQVLFNPYHCGECLELGASSVRMAIGKMNNKQVVKLTNSKVKDVDFRKLNNAGENFLTEEGVIELISKCNKVTREKKARLLRVLFPNKEVVGVTSRKEIEFIDQLEETLKPFNLIGIRQYKINSYRIDYYIPSLNLAIEYDENDHQSYSYEAHEGRQKEIEATLKCRFIRVTDDNTNNFNIGLVLKEMFNM